MTLDVQNLPECYAAWTWMAGTEPIGLARQSIIPEPLAADEVYVRNAVIGLNPVDWKVLGGHLVDWAPGHVPGVDGAGIVVAVGESVPATWLGQRVAYHQSLQRPGSFAEYTPVRARALLRMPPALEFFVAAGVPCPALTS